MIRGALHIISLLVLIVSVQVTYCKADAKNPFPFPPLPLFPAEIYGPGCYDSSCTPLYSESCSMKGWHYGCSLAFPGNYLESCACLLVTSREIDGCYCKNYNKQWIYNTQVPSCPFVLDPTRHNGSMSNIDGVLTCDVVPGCYSLTCMTKNQNQEAHCKQESHYCTQIYPGDYLKNCACALNEANYTLHCECETSQNPWEKVHVPDNCIGKSMSYKGGKLQCDETSAFPQTAEPVKPRG